MTVCAGETTSPWLTCLTKMGFCTTPPLVGDDPLHLSGKMAVEMMFHHKFGTNGGSFPISGVKFMEENVAWYFIIYRGRVVPSVAYLSSETEDGKIDRLNILPM